MSKAVKGSKNRCGIVLSYAAADAYPLFRLYPYICREEIMIYYNCSVPLTVTAKIHPKSPLAMDFSTPESLSYGQRKALACAAKCAALLNSYVLNTL